MKETTRAHSYRARFVYDLRVGTLADMVVQERKVLGFLGLEPDDTTNEVEGVRR